MRLRFLVVSMIVLALSAGTGYAQTFTGMIDGYWSYNGNTPIQGGQRVNVGRAFDLYDQAFSLNYGELAVDYKPNNVGIRVDVGFGDAAEVVAFNETDIWRHIQQAYITGTAGKLTMDFGKWVTPFGAEVIETKDNLNYTRGFVFTLGIPFYHMGGRATYGYNDKVSIAGYVVNGWDNVKENNSAKSIGVNVTVKPHKMVGVIGNYLYGKESSVHDDARELYEGILNINPLDRVALTGDFVYGRDHESPISPGIPGARVLWKGLAGYAKVKLFEKVNVNGRYEWFDDHDGFRTSTAQELQSATVTAQIIPTEGLNVWTEFRKDWSDHDVFLRTQAGVFAPVDTFRDHQNTFTVGVTYTFTKMVK
jgi:Putative beta-barrel porin-2, OmpL-like. bbp2